MKYQNTHPRHEPAGSIFHNSGPLSGSCAIKITAKQKKRNYYFKKIRQKCFNLHAANTLEAACCVNN